MAYVIKAELKSALNTSKMMIDEATVTVTFRKSKMKLPVQ